MSAAAHKPHFAVLDGLRGMAALLILLYHLEGSAFGFRPATMVLAHAPLMVDFFFCLSGFVLAYAYDDRWSAMSFGRFIRIRLIRLHPLLLLGLLLGLASYLFDPFAGGRQHATAALLTVATLAMALALPGPDLPNRGGATHPLNSAEWSLFWEYLASLAYGLVLRRLSNRALLIVTGVAALALLALALRIGVIAGGPQWPTIYIAPIRLAFPFAAGLALYRFRGSLPRIRIGFLPLTIALLLGAVLPFIPMALGIKWNGLYEALTIILLFPTIILCGSHDHAGPAMERLCKLSGRLSYPLYVTHIPFVYLYKNWAETPRDTAALLMAGAGVVLLVIAFAWAASALWDEPIRKRLAKLGRG